MLILILHILAMAFTIIGKIFQEVTVDRINKLSNLEKVDFTFSKAPKSVRILGYITVASYLISIACFGAEILLILYR